MKSLRRRLAVFAATGALFAGLLVAMTGTASADYGQGAVHQVVISSSITPNAFGPGTGGGIWLWIELDGSSPTSGGTGEYTGSDCLHHIPFLGPTGAHPDSGDDVTWSSDGTTITIIGVVIGGDHTPVTITVPESGHESLSGPNLLSLFSAPVGGLPGSAQVEVAP
jgi:hypothetical protein